MSKIFGQRLQKLRVAKGLFQNDLAAEFNITRAAISAWERGIKEPNMNDILKLCDIFETTPNYLLGFDDET